MNQDVVILGAGLSGSLLSILLAQQGKQVHIYEKRPDPRGAAASQGRSINLALSHRGIQALEQAGLADSLRQIAIPMHGRMMHSVEGALTFQPYGTAGQYINSVSRGVLNRLLIEQAATRQVSFHFEHTCEDVHLVDNTIFVRDEATQKMQEVIAGLLIGADGAFSVLRNAMQKTPRFDYSQHYIAHGYKELTIPASATGDFAMEPHALHIWPRGGHMLIALPNQDKSFTCTLFLAYEGNESFEKLQTEEDVLAFFNRYFPDALSLIPHLTDDFFTNPTSDLVTIHCYPWSRYHHNVLLGDAAHAIVPFYGQGMNAAFEDCHIFNKLLTKHGTDTDALIAEFQRTRKPDADAIAELALQNFVEMRDKVADDAFLERKKIEAELHRRYPDQWIPLYTMVTFTDIPYAEALETGRKQDRIMEEVMKEFTHLIALTDQDFENIVARLL